MTMLTALAQIFIGNSPRLMRLNPASFCASDCVRVNIQMKGTFVQDPGDPRHCSPTNNAFNKVSARVTVTNEVSVLSRASSSAAGSWTTTGPTSPSQPRPTPEVKSPSRTGVRAALGAVVFLVDSATQVTQTLDKTAGVLSSSVILQ